MVNGDIFKKTMRQLASGVTIISGLSEDRSIHAMTATAFLPVSIDPPFILISVDRRNDTHAHIQSSTHFGVTLLSECQDDLSTRYAMKEEGRYRFDDIQTFRGPRGCLFFSGCSAAIEAELDNEIPVGDHTLFLGRVVWMDVYPELRPLVFYQTKYHKVAGRGREAGFRSQHVHR